MEKKFLLAYIPASLHKYDTRWTIQFYQLNPDKGVLVRHYKTFNINRIKDQRMRMRRANEIIKHLNEDLLPNGWPYVDMQVDETRQQKKSVDFFDALEFAYKVKIRNKSKGSENAYRNQYKTFFSWLECRGYSFDIRDLSKKYAQLYLDYLKFDLSLGPYAYNNHLGFVKSLFTILIDREYIFKNPFDGFAREQKTQSRFRVFSAEERKVVAQRIFEEDIWLFRSIILMYQCYIRKAELLRLRFNMFDFQKGIIRMPLGIVKKNKKVNVRTIPKALMKYFIMEDFTSPPANFLVFGKGFKPHANKTCSLNTPTSRHRKIIDLLEREGKLFNVKNLHLYSWKFTGITDNLEEMDLQHVFAQAGHSDPKITMGYRRAPEVNSQFKELDVDLF